MTHATANRNLDGDSLRVAGFRGDANGVEVTFGDRSRRYFPRINPARLRFADLRRMLRLVGRRMSFAELDHFFHDLRG